MRHFIFYSVFLSCFQYNLESAEMLGKGIFEDEVLCSKISYASVPDYTEIYTRELKKAPACKLNHFSIAHLNQLLSRHGDYELLPDTYVDVTTLTHRYGIPIDLAFSQETAEARVFWQNNFCCFKRVKTHVFKAVPYSQVFPQLMQAESRQKICLPPLQDLVRESPLPVARMIPRTGMSEQDAERLLSFNFNKFGEIRHKYYLPRNQYVRIIRDLASFGDAEFDVQVNESNDFFLVLSWQNGQRQYMLYPWSRA